MLEFPHLRKVVWEFAFEHECTWNSIFGFSVAGSLELRLCLAAVFLTCLYQGQWLRGNLIWERTVCRKFSEFGWHGSILAAILPHDMLVLQLLGWQHKKIVGCSFWQMASPGAAGKKVVFSEVKGLKAHWDNCVEARERMKDFGPANSHEESVMFQQMDFEPDIWSEAKLLECCV